MYIPSVQTIDVGGSKFSMNDPRLIKLKAFNPGSGTFSALRREGFSGSYVVTAGKTLYLPLIEIYSTGASETLKLAQATGDAGFGGGSPAGLQYMNNDGSCSQFFTSPTTLAVLAYKSVWVVPANNIPTVDSASSGGVSIWINAFGYEI